LKHEQVLQQIKAIITQDMMLRYPQFDKPYQVYTNASKMHIGSAVMKEEPLGFFSKKMNETQKNYPVTEQELSAIIKTLKYFKHMLLSHMIIVHADHKNLKRPNSVHSPDHVL